MEKQTVLIVDDEPDILELLEITLLRMGLEVYCANNYSEATRQLNTHRVDFCLTDMKLPDGDGITLVEFVQQNFPDIPIAVITAHGNMELAIQAMKAGAYDFVSKPVSLEKLRHLIEKGLETASTPEPAPENDKYQIIGESAPIESLRKNIRKFARSQAPVFIEGESGTGKELVARQIHAQGARASKPFIAINCGAIPAELMESEFFGHLKGSFTGAIQDNPGIFKSADSGTLFLDEIADLPLNMQVKLLRVIQEKSIRPIGAAEEIEIDVRIISASHKNLSQLVESGSFRQDLYYRVNVINIHVPALRERTEDIPVLSRYLINKLSVDSPFDFQLSDAAMDKLRHYPFAGNVRELENILERACALSETGIIDEQDIDLPETLNSSNPSQHSLLEKTSTMESEELKKALIENRWNQSAAARQLGMTLRQLRYRCEKLGLTKS